MRGATHNYNSLVHGMARGDERAAATLFDALSPVLFVLALRIVDERAAAEEVVLEAFTQAWTIAGSYQSDCGSVLSWLSMIARARALDCVRARARGQMLPNPTPPMGDEPLAPGPSSNRLRLGFQHLRKSLGDLEGVGSNSARLQLS